MSDAFNALPKSVGVLLGTSERKTVAVPRFQRGYSWEKKHYSAFWKDLIQFKVDRETAGGPKQYFLGPIVIMENEEEEVIELLDGQQRLATITILLAAIRDVSRKIGTTENNDHARDIQRDLIEKDEGVYSLQLGDIDRTYFRETIQLDDMDRRLEKGKTKSQQAIYKAYTFFRDKVSGLISTLDPRHSRTTLKALVKIVQSDLVMASISVGSERDAFQIFETLNDRGLRLSVPDLLLVHLMKVAKPESDRDEIRALWNEIVELMGRRDTNRFLRHMWVSKYGDLKSTDLFSALKETIEGENTSSIEFVRLCNHECERYVELLDIHRDHLKSAAEYVDRLIKKLNIKSALPLLLSCYTRVSEEDFERIVRSILVFVVRYDVVSGLDVSGMESTFFTLAREVREMVKQKKSAQCARHIKEVLQKGSPTDEQVESFVADLQLNRDDAAYVLGRIAFRKGTNTKERGIHEANLEHIYPKNPKKDEWGGKENQEELNQYLNHIGNLTILGERINAGIANSEFSVKKPYYENSELKISNEVGWYNDWNVDTIKKRAQGLAKSVLEIWNFENTSWV